MPVVDVGDKVQLVDVPESKIPVELLAKLIEPVGVIWVGGDVSVTVAVHAVWPPAPESADGLQTMVVEVARMLTARIAEPLLFE